MAIALAAPLAHCTGATMMGLDVTDYRAVFGKTTDEQALVAILRARDRAPLHFTELQSLGASMQLTSSLQATDPFAKPNGSSQRAQLQGNLGAQNNPTFSLTTLETQGFTKGLLTPVEPVYIKQFLDSDIDPRVLFLLFFAGIKLPSGVTWINTSECPNERCPYIGLALKKINDLTTSPIHANIYVELEQVGSSYDANKLNVKDISSIDFAKFRLKTLNGRSVLYSVSAPKLALCAEMSGRLVDVMSGHESQRCHETEIIVSNRFRPRAPELLVRSAYQIIQYLGQVIRFQERHAAENRCLKLDNQRPYACDQGDVFFQVNAARGEPIAWAHYDGSQYAVSVGPCPPRREARVDPYCDHSAEVLKILIFLINANKSAADIPVVPLVKTIQ